MSSALLNNLFRRAEKITKQYKNCLIIFEALVSYKKWWAKDSGGANLVTAVITAAHSAPPFSCDVDATLRWETATTQQ